MTQWTAALLVVAGFFATTLGCGGSTRQSVLFASWSAGPYAPQPDHTLLRLDADDKVDVERWSEGEGRWELVCRTPCEESVPARSTYRLVSGATSSRPFGLPQLAWSWMYLRFDADGSVWMVDSPDLRARHARAGAGGGLMLFGMRAR